MENNAIKQDVDIRQVIKEQITKLGSSASKEEKQKYAQTFLKVFEQGIPLGQVLGITEIQLAEVYRFAYSEFHAGHYEIAAELFKAILKLNPMAPEIGTCLGVCFHRLGKYEQAIIAYMNSAVLEETNPMPYFYAYDCYQRLNQPYAAFLMISSALARAANQPQYAELKEKAELLVEGSKAYLQTWEAPK